MNLNASAEGPHAGERRLPGRAGAAGHGAGGRERAGGPERAGGGDEPEASATAVGRSPAGDGGETTRPRRGRPPLTLRAGGEQSFGASLLAERVALHDGVDQGLDAVAVRPQGGDEIVRRPAVAVPDRAGERRGRQAAGEGPGEAVAVGQ